jgi:uncharacterized protein (UPF0335 family)
MIAFDVKSVPEMARNMGFDEKTVRDTIMFKIYDISRVARRELPRGGLLQHQRYAELVTEEYQ